ncbi:chondroadherin-like [Culicoides brevitarsis]|uniref:chondroadherin-like n=1 Tax=Culicoides brevitarsis TaxID=469753 RepID=UPI00307BDB34
MDLFVFLLLLTSASIVESVSLAPKNIFTRLQFHCEYKTNELQNTSTCVIRDFHPGTSLFHIENPENSTRLEFVNSQHVRIPKAVFLEVPSLESLNLSSTGVRRIQKSSFDNAMCLVSLDLSHNLLQIIAKSTFKRALNLQELYLDNNQIEVVEYSAFKYLRNLTILTLNDNRIKYLSDHAFEQLSNLRTLLLNNNAITVISSALKPLLSLETLTLDNNALHYVRIKVLNKHLRHLKSITLRKNAWICAGMKIMTDYLEANMVRSDLEDDGQEVCTQDEDVMLMMNEKDLMEIQELSVSTFVNPAFSRHFNKKRSNGVYF